MSRSGQIALSIPTLAVVLISLSFLWQGPLAQHEAGIDPGSERADAYEAAPRTSGAPNTVIPIKDVDPRIDASTTIDPPFELQSSASLPELLAENGIEVKREPSRPSISAATRIPIVEYHYSTFYFDGVMMKPEWFVEQMEWLAAHGFYTLTIDELADFIEGSAAPPRPAVALTFDVGISHFDDYREVVIPTLRRLGLHGIFFIQTQGVQEECDGKFTCWDTVAAWIAEGLISIGSHTVYHQDFATLTPAQILVELRRSKEVIQERLGVTVIGVCYPFDSVNPDAFPLLELLGYRFAVAGWTRSDRSAHFADRDRYGLPRYYPYSNDRLYPAISGSGGLPFSELMEAGANPVP